MLDNQEALTQAVKSRNRWRAVAVASLILVLVVMLPFTIVMNDVFRTSWSKYLSARKVTTGTTQTQAVTPKVKQLPEAKSKDPPSGKVTTGTAAVAEPVLYYESCGTGKPLILIHGGQLDCRMWDDQFQQFSQYFQVVRYDVRGYGKSDLPTRPYADEEDLLGLLQFLHIDKAHLVGLSLGGRIAIDFALQHPERVRSVVAAGPGLSGFNWSAEGERQAMVIVRAARDQGAEKAAELWLRDPYMTPAMENPALAKRLHRLALENARCWLVNPLLGRELQPPPRRNQHQPMRKQVPLSLTEMRMGRARIVICKVRSS
jgi:pimeloyl-ACP methyl ester carboxylesterase